MRVLCVADDLTGALEAGAEFAQYGHRSVVLTTTAGSSAIDDVDVLVIDTESRHVTPEEAKARVLALASIVHGAELIYKKTDSTLRGNIGPELEALSLLARRSRIAYVPAYPAVQRTARHGKLYVNGRPVDQTAFARDHLNPVADAYIRSVLPDGLDCDIFDGETDDDVESSAKEILSSADYGIIAGPGAIARELAKRLSGMPGRAATPGFPGVRSCLVVNGSRHPVSAEQVRHAAEHGPAWRVISPEPDEIVSEAECAFRLGYRVRTELDRTMPDAVIVFGGDTAYGILSALGLPALRPLGGILPGVAVSSIEGRSTTLITKAGGFGSPDLLLQLEKRLHDR